MDYVISIEPAGDVNGAKEKSIHCKVLHVYRSLTIVRDDKGGIALWIN
jgi:hypothetical protein